MVGDKYGILGPFQTEQKAKDTAEDKLRHAIKYGIYPLDTKNKSAASGKLKAVILDETKDIGQAMQRIRRKDPTDETFKEKPVETDNNVQKIAWF
jgi:hypothetical protein